MPATRTVVVLMLLAMTSCRGKGVMVSTLPCTMGG
jgi:hypothetical protein